MSKYQVLARKYRPKNFDQLIGQNHVSQALANAIDTGRLHHAYLFTGTRGVGKTTIARILAKCLNCETGITSTPCGTCDTCVSVDEGRFIDLIEIDAASRTKVEDTRELLENVPYAPTQGRYKVYLIDEVHMLSTHSFNALLKTLEEPPEHVKFILATTDPQKLPITIVSRCLQFVLRPLSQELLHHHLNHILRSENISFNDDALWQLAKSAKGSVRDALSLTDQAIAFGGGQLESQTVSNMLGLVDGIDVLTLICDIYQDNRTQVAHHIDRMRLKMVDAVGVLDALVDSLHEVAMMQVLPVMVDENNEQKQLLVQISRQIPADVLQLYYEICLKARESVRLATTPMQALEMGILRLLAFRPLAVGEVVLSNQEIENQEIENQEIENQEIENQEIENQEIENQEIENQEIENQEIENQEIENQEIENQEIENQEIENQEIENQEIENQEIENQEIENQEIENQEIENQEIENQEIENQEIENQEIENQEIENQEIENQEIENQEIENQEIENQEIENQEIENQEIENQEIENQEIENQEIENQEIETSNNSHLILSKHQLQAQLLAPKVDLAGEWTTQKWDYWLSQARQEMLLDADELALMGQSVMVGEIDGVCTLYVPEHNHQVQLTFDKFAYKFAEFYPNTTLQSLATIDALDDVHRSSMDYTPSKNQARRQQAVVIQAQQQMLHSPVLQHLWYGGYIDQSQGALGQPKLLLD